MSYENCEHDSDPYCCLPCQGYRATVVERAARDIRCRVCKAEILKGELLERTQGIPKCYRGCQ